MLFIIVFILVHYYRKGFSPGGGLPACPFIVPLNARVNGARRPAAGKSLSRQTSFLLWVKGCEWRGCQRWSQHFGPIWLHHAVDRHEGWGAGERGSTVGREEENESLVLLRVSPSSGTDTHSPLNQKPMYSIRSGFSCQFW